MNQTPDVNRLARRTLLLLLAINLFNYLDRFILAAVLPQLQYDATLFSPTDPNLNWKLGTLTTAFLVSYMLFAPLFGWLGDRMSRWMLVAFGVIVWSLASGASGLATSFLILFFTRCLVGIGEAAYGPVAPSLLSDMFPVEKRGMVLSWFYIAIPVGSALGFVLGGLIADTSWGWRGAFYVVVLPGLVLGGLCLLMKEPPREQPVNKPAEPQGSYFVILAQILRIKSYSINTLGMTALTFVLGGVSVWMPVYVFNSEARFQITPAAIAKIEERRFSNGQPAVPPEFLAALKPLAGETVYDHAQLREKLKSLPKELEPFTGYVFELAVTADSPTLSSINGIFGGIVVLSGLGATMFGGWLSDRLRPKIPASYFLVPGASMLICFPLFLAALFTPFPYAWGLMFLAIFALFVNTGPTNAILANVTPSPMRSTAFALNILIIHLFGDAAAPMLIGYVTDVSSLRTAFVLTSFFVLLGGVVWIIGMRYLPEDTARASAA